MKKYILLLLLIVPFLSNATIWKVGPTKTYTTPSQVASLVNNNDTVEIDAATYLGDVCAWYASNLLLKGVGGKPHLRANGQYVLGKGIWVFAGNNITADNIEFSEAAVPDANGAGIRLDGIGIKIKNCYFHNNENGILTNNTNAGNIIIDNSEFGFNGDGVGQAHNIYIGRVDSAIIRFCYFHHANVGHEFKSRARVNFLLYNRFSNEATGNASREIDLPNGGVTFLIGNILHQGPNGQNGNVVGYGLEGLVNAAPHEIYVINNTFVNERTAGGSFLQANAATTLIKVYNNIFAGPATIINFGGSSTIIDSLTNKIVNNIAIVGFINAAAYNYQIAATSLAINAGTNSGNANNGLSLMPVFQYMHPVSFMPRTLQSTTDIGAYELSATVVPLNLLQFTGTAMQQKIMLQWQTTEEKNISAYEIMLSNDGINFVKKVSIPAKNNNNNFYEWADNTSIEKNFYRLKIISQDGTFTFSKIISVINKKNNEIGVKISFSNKHLHIFNLPNQFKNNIGMIRVINAAGAVVFNQEAKFYSSNNWVSSLEIPIGVSGYLVVGIDNGISNVNIPIFVQ